MERRRAHLLWKWDAVSGTAGTPALAHWSLVKSSRTDSTKLSGVIGKPKRASRELTRKEHDAKVAKLRNAVATGALTQDQFDRYDAELVTCLK